MADGASSLTNRLDTTKYILDLSYRLISHYDSKTNQLLVLVGFNFAVVGVSLTVLFDSIATLSVVMRAVIIGVSLIDFFLIGIALYHIRDALIPHVNHVGKGTKPKPGLAYFMDIKRYLGEDEYVKTMLGVDGATRSKYYEASDSEAFEKCIIEDFARDIFAHAEILELKTRHVKKSFEWTIGTTVTVFASVLILAVLMACGV